MWKGYFNQYKRACLDITINAPNASNKPISAIIDTGFDGFVQIDFQLAVALGWVTPKTNIGQIRIADGKLINVGLVNDASVTIGGDTVTGVCQFPFTPQAPYLIGMDLLRRAERVLVISKNTILLPKEQDIQLGK